MPGKIFEHKHTVYFSETNAMGGVVYYSNYVKWQGETREAFLVETVPEWKVVMQEVAKGNVNMLTTEEYSHFIQHAFFGDKIIIKIHAEEVKKFSFKIIFKMYKVGTDALIYEGWQRVGFDDFKGHFVPIPEPMLRSILEHTPPDEIKKYENRYNLISKE
jgi:enediyne biosynthesis thioesterase